MTKLEQQLQTKSVHEQNQNRYFVKMRLRIEELEGKLKETTLNNPMPIMSSFDQRVFDSKVSELKRDLKAENFEKLRNLDVHKEGKNNIRYNLTLLGLFGSNLKKSVHFLINIPTDIIAFLSHTRTDTHTSVLGVAFLNFLHPLCIQSI